MTSSVSVFVLFSDGTLSLEHHEGERVSDLSSVSVVQTHKTVCLG